jgi:DHA1 family bicyclomycin/chloramphenicol resistance-like MFS transporter
MHVIDLNLILMEILSPQKFMPRSLLPPLWLLMLILGLPNLSDTFTASMPKIVTALKLPVTSIEYAYTTYILGLAIGMLFWGEFSDRLSHKLCILAGLVVFIAGCTVCYYADDIALIVIGRFVQAFGTSACYVLGHAICRRSFHGRNLGKAYASIESALAILPVLGSFLSSLVEAFSWRALFSFLSLLACALSLTIAIRLPDTHTSTALEKKDSILGVARRMFKDKKVIGYGLIMAGCFGIYYSYYVEGITYLVNLLGLSANEFDSSFILISAAYMIGGIISNRLHDIQSSGAIMWRGIIILVVGSFVFSCLTVLHVAFIFLPNWMLALMAVLSQACIMFGSGMIVSNALALALADYHWCIGASSSIFGSFYYTIVALITFGMRLLHNGTLLPMPLYFFGIGVLMLIVRQTVIKND